MSLGEQDPVLHGAPSVPIHRLDVQGKLLLGGWPFSTALITLVMRYHDVQGMCSLTFHASMCSLLLHVLPYDN